jgi:hypothetical protein
VWPAARRRAGRRRWAATHEAAAARAGTRLPPTWIASSGPADPAAPPLASQLLPVNAPPRLPRADPPTISFISAMNHRATLFLALAAVGLAMCNAQAACTFYKPLNGTETKCWPSTEQVPARAPAASPWPLLPLPAGCPAPRSPRIPITSQCLPDSLGQLTALGSLRLDKCCCLQQLPESLVQLSALCSLCLDHCTRLQQLPESLGRLSALRSLELRGCKSLVELPQSLGRLQALRSLDLRWCRGLKRLPNSLGPLTALSSLNLGGCSGLVELPESLPVSAAGAAAAEPERVQQPRGAA